MIIINPSFEVLDAPTGSEALKRIEVAGRTCFSEDTELLTFSGWKKVTDIKSDEHVLTYNMSHNTLEYQVSNMFSKYYSGNMLVTNHRLSSFCITPDHNVVATKVTNKGNYTLMTADNLLKNDNNFGYALPLWFAGCSRLVDDYHLNVVMEDCLYFSGKPLHECVVKGKNFWLDDAFLTVVGAYVSDGHLQSGNKGIVITKSKGSVLIDKLVGALNALGWDYRVELSAGRDDIISVVIGGGEPVGNWFESCCGRGSLNKTLPLFFRKLSNRQLNHLLEVLFLGDGYEGSVYKSSSEVLIDQINEIYVLLGKSGNVVCRSDKYGGWQKNNNYSTRINKRDSIIIKPAQVKNITYKGYVYCTQTDNGVVCMRHKGKVLWIGNCYKSENKITDNSSQSFVKGIIKSGHHSVIEHVNMTVRFICDRGISHELVRHRLAAYSQESTRYANYSKEKFGKEITVIKPVFWDENSEEFACWLNAMRLAEKSYMALIDMGASPQQARSVLPNSLKTEIVMTANMREWRHVFKLRCSKAAHPQIREVMLPLLGWCYHNIPVLFDDLWEEYNNGV